MATTFDYPNAVSPTVTVTGVAEILPAQRDTDLGYVMIETAGRVLKTARLGSDIELLPLNIKNITDALKTSLKNFFVTTVQGSTKTFSYTDALGVVNNNCRLVSSKLSFRKTSKLLWELNILLRIDP